MKSRHDADSLTTDMIYAPQSATIGTNLYAWCGNNPVSRVDQSGQSWLSDLLVRGARAVVNIAAGIGAGISGAQSSGGGGAYGLGCRMGSRARSSAKKAVAAVKAAVPQLPAWTRNGPSGGKIINAHASGRSSSSNRSNLGIAGNFIRGQVNSNFGKELFENYWNSGGDIELSDNRFKDIINTCIPESDSVTVALSNGTWGKKQTLNCYGSSEYALAIGRGTAYLNKTGFVGFSDTYDFDSHGGIFNSERSWDAELFTQATAGAGYFNGATGFAIYYGVTENQ